MNFDYLLAELRSAADEFKQNIADKCLSTALFCQRACKAIDKVTAEADTFENQVIGLWVIVGYINDLIVQLADGDSLTELSNKLFQQCARTVLDIQWQQLDEDTPSRQNFQASLASCHDQMMPRGYTRFALLQSLMDQPWTEPTLSLVMGSEEDNEDGEGLAYIKMQDPEILRLRVELMLQENCDEFALNLCTWCLKHPTLEQDLSLRCTQVTLLHRLGNEDRLQEECQKIGVEDSIKLITSLQEKEDAHELCTVLAQTVLVQNWIKPSNHQSKQKLLHLWIRQQHQADPDHDKFVSSLWAVAKLSPSTEQLLHIIDAVKEQCGDEFIQFYTDLCVFALNVDKVYWEKLVKEGAATGEEAVARKRDMAKVCQKLAVIIAHVSPKIAFCCALTAFAFHPSEELLQAVCECHASKSRANLLDLQKSKEIKEDKVNIATLYEVERLCGMLRPAYLSPDNDFPNLFAMCKQYLRKESGEASKLGLPALMRSQKGTITSPPVSSDASGQARNSITNNLSAAGKPIQEAPGFAGNMGSVPSITTDPMQSLAVHVPTEMSKVETVSAQQQQQVLSPKPLLATLMRPQITGQTPLQVANRPVTSLEVSLVQQMVMKQLSTDVIQTLLQLVQSGHVSPQQLSQVLSHPGITAEALQNLVLRASNQKATAGQKGPARQQPQTQVQQKPSQAQAQLQHLQQQQLRQQQLQQQQQQQLQKQQQQQFQQQQNLQQQLQQQQLQQQKLQKQLQELQLAKCKEQAAMGQTAVLQPQQKVVLQQLQTIPKTVKIEARQAQQTSCLATATPLQTRIVTDQVVVQPLSCAQRPESAPRQPKVHTVQLQRQHFLTGVQQVRPALASNVSISTLRLTSDGQLQSVQLLAFPQQGAPQPQGEPPNSAAQLVLHTTSHMLTHMSGGTITAIAKSDTVEPRMAVHLQPSESAVKSSSMTSSPVSGSPLAPQIKALGAAAQHMVTVSATVAPQSTTTYSADGNRHYLINNLLFTGETQNSTLSIALPDTLPEISVDSVSDTLRALGDPSASNQARGSVVSAQQAASGAPGPSQVKQPSQSQPQVLPSIATLFAPSRQTTLLPTPVALNKEETTTNKSVPSSSSGNPGVALKVQKKTGSEKSPGRGTKKEGEVKTTLWSKEDLTKLLRQAMTLNMDKKQESSTNTGSSYLHLPEHQVMTPSQTKTAATAMAAVHPHPSPAVQPRLHLQASLQPTMQNQTQELLGQQVGQTAAPGPNLREGSFQEQQASSVPQPLKHGIVQPSVFSPGSSLHFQISSPSIIPAARVQTSAVLSSAGSKVLHPSAAASLPQLTHIREAHPTLGCVPASVRCMLSNSQGEHIPVSGLVAASTHVLPSPKIEQLTVDQPVACTVRKNVPTYPAYNSALNPGNISAISTLSVAEPVQNSTSAEGIPVINEKTVVASKPDIASTNLVPAAASMSSSPNICPAALSRYPQQQLTQPFSGPSGCEAAVAPQPAAAPASSSALENGGILVDNRSGESIATYRCIICSMPFMTLDDLRIHVRQICRPGVHPPSLGDRMALNKAQALEAGLETSTVFQCMRCYELCISDSGIREHKLVCSKAPKPKPKPRPRPKSKSPKLLSEEEQATEAKVLELLNKCLGENREKLLNSEASSPKKKQMGEQESAEDVEAKKKKKLAKKKSPVPAEENLEEQVESADGAQPPDVKPKPKRAKKKAEQSEGKGDSTSLPDAGKEFTEKEAAYSNPAQTGESKPKPKRRSCPKKGKTVEAGTVPSGGQTKGTDIGSIDNGKERERIGQKNSRKPKPSALPPPMYKEVSGSGGRSFYKCVICGQTLCSLVNFAEHWAECIAKNPPPPPKPRRVSKDKKQLQTRALSDVAGHTEEHKKSTLPSELQLQEDSGCAIKCELITADESDITQEVHLKPVLPARDLFETNAERTPVYANDTLAFSAKEARSFQENSFQDDCHFLKQEFGDAPLFVAADDIEVVSELNVETTTEIQESYPLVKDPVVLLEKVELPDKVQCINIKGRFSSDETEVFGTMAENTTDTLELPLSSKQCVHGQLKVPVRKKLGKFSSQKSRRLKGSRNWRKGDSVHAKVNRATIAIKNIRKAAVHLPSESYCSLCQKNFHKKQILIQHFASRHLHAYTVKKLGDTSSYFCHMCQRVFSQFSLYLGHVHNHSQAILKKIQDMSLNDAAGRSRRIACQRGVPGQTPSRHGRTSPRGLTIMETWSSDSGSRDVDKSGPESLSSDTSNPASDASSVRSLSGKPDRQRSGRDAQKQALSKIYIGALGIYSQEEGYQEYGKKRVTETDDDSDSKMLKKRKLEVAENSLDEASSEETFGSWGEVRDSDKEEARGLVADADSNITEDSSRVVVHDQKVGSIAGEDTGAIIEMKAVDKNENQSSPPVGLPSASESTSPGISPASAGKKPTFLDSYMNYISKRTPEEPLPLNRCRKRYASAGNRQEALTTASSIYQRRSSCEAQQSSTLYQIVSPKSSSLRASSAVQVQRSPVLSSNNTGTGVSLKHPWEGIDLSRVYYIGNFEQQLIQKCSVNLGTRVLPSEIERLTKQAQTVSLGNISQEQADKDLKSTEWEALISKPVIILEKLDTLQEKAGAQANKNARTDPAENDALKTGSEMEPQIFSNSCDPRTSHEHSEVVEHMGLRLVTDCSSELHNTIPVVLCDASRDLSSEADVSEGLSCPSNVICFKDTATVAQLPEEMASSANSQAGSLLGCESEIMDQQLDLPMDNMEQTPELSRSDPSEIPAGDVESVLCSEPRPKNEVSVLDTFELVSVMVGGKEKCVAENSRSLSLEPAAGDEIEKIETVLAEKVEEPTDVDQSVVPDYDQEVSVVQEGEKALKINEEVGESCSAEAIFPTVESSTFFYCTNVDALGVQAPNDVSVPVDRCLVDQSFDREPHIHQEPVQSVEAMNADTEKAFDGCYWGVAVVQETTGSFSSKIEQVQPGTAVYPSVETASESANILADITSGCTWINKQDDKSVADQWQAREKLALEAEASQVSGESEQEEATSNEQPVCRRRAAEDQSVPGSLAEQSEPEDMRTEFVVNDAELSLVVCSNSEEEYTNNSQCCAVQESMAAFHEHGEWSGKESFVSTTHSLELGIDASDSLENCEDVVKIIDLSGELLSVDSIQNVTEAASNSDSLLIETDPVSLSEPLHCHCGSEKTESSDAALGCTDSTVKILNRDKNACDMSESLGVVKVEEKADTVVQVCCSPHLEVLGMEAVKDRPVAGHDHHSVKLDAPESPTCNRDAVGSCSVECGNSLAEHSEQGMSVASEMTSGYLPGHTEEDVCGKQDVKKDVCDEMGVMPSAVKEDLVQNTTTEHLDVALNSDSVPALAKLVLKSKDHGWGQRQPNDLVQSAVSLEVTETIIDKELPMSVKSQMVEVDDSVLCAFVLAEMGNTISMGPAPSELQTSARIDETGCRTAMATGMSSVEDATGLRLEKSDFGQKTLENLVQKEITESRIEIPAKDRGVESSEDIAEMDQLCLIQQTSESHRQLDSLPTEQFIPDDYREESLSVFSASLSRETNAVGNIADNSKDSLTSETKMTKTVEIQESGSEVISALSSTVFHLQERLAKRDETYEVSDQEVFRPSTSESFAGIKIVEHSECKTSETCDASKAGEPFIEDNGELGQMISAVCGRSEILSFCSREQAGKRENLSLTEVGPQQEVLDTNKTISTVNIESNLSTSPPLSVKEIPESFREAKDSCSLNLCTDGIVSDEMNVYPYEEIIDSLSTSQGCNTSLLPEPAPESYRKTSELCASSLNTNTAALDESMAKSHGHSGCLSNVIIFKTDEVTLVHSEVTESWPLQGIKHDLSESVEVTSGSCEEVSLTAEPGAQVCGEVQESFDQNHHGVFLDKSESEISNVSQSVETSSPSHSGLVHESTLKSDAHAATTTSTGVTLAVDCLSTSVHHVNIPSAAQSLSDVIPGGGKCSSGEETKPDQDMPESCEGVQNLTSTDLDLPKEKASDDEDRIPDSMDTKSNSTSNSNEVGEAFINPNGGIKGMALCCSSLEDLASACHSCRLRIELAGKRDCGPQKELTGGFASTGLGNPNGGPSGLPLEPEGACSERIQTESDAVLNPLEDLRNVDEKEAAKMSEVQPTHRLRDSQKQAQASSMMFTSIQEVREDHSAAGRGRVLRSASAGNLMKEAAKQVLDDKSVKKHCRSSPAATDVIDEANKQTVQCKSGPSRTSTDLHPPTPESSPKHMTRNQAAGKGKKQAEDSLDQDPDCQLPELCIVTEPRQRKLNLRPDFLEMSSTALRGISKKNKVAVDNRASIRVSEDPNTVVSAVLDSHEVRIVMLKGGGKKQGSDSCQPSQTYTVAKTHTVEPESLAVVETETSRKPLKGVKSLRQLIQPKPFVWEMDDAEDSSKQARNERSGRAFRKQVSVGPFTWDMEEAEQDGSGESAEVTDMMQPRTTPDTGEDRSDGKIMPSRFVAEREMAASKSQAVKQPLGCSLQPAFSTGEDTQLLSSAAKNLSRNSSAKKMGGSLFSFVPASEETVSIEYSTDVKEENPVISDQSAQIKRRAFKQKSGNCASPTAAEVEEPLRSKSVVNPIRRISLETRSDISCREGMQEATLSKDLGKTKDGEETPGHLNTRSMRKRKLSGTPETRCSSLPPKRLSEGEGKQKTKSGDLAEGNSRVMSQGPSLDGPKAVRSKDTSPSIDSPARGHSSTATAGGGVPGNSCQEVASCAADTGNNINRVVHTRGADIRNVVRSLRSKEVVADTKLCGSSRPVHSASSSSDADSVKGKLIYSKENSPDQDSASNFRLLRSKESSPVLDSHSSNLLNKDKSLHTGTAANVRSLRLKKSCSSDLDTHMAKTEGVGGKGACSGTSTEGRMNIGIKDIKIPTTASITCAVSTSEPSGNATRVHRTRQSSGDVGPKTHLKDGSPSTVSESLARLTRTKESTPFDNRGRPRHQNVNAAPPAKSLRSGLARPLPENAGSTPSQLRKDKVEQGAAELQRKDQVDVAQLQAEVHSRRLTASAHVPHPTVQVRSPRRSLQVSAEPLRAMVRRRPKTSLSTAVPVKKPRILHSQVQHQVEVIRVEPVVPPQNNSRRTRSHDRDPSPHTVHTRISAEEYQASSSKKAVVKSTDQKWLMNRCIAPSSRKGVPEQRFPFAFKLARSRTQTK